jgi:formylglycine-generating enzyme required for sulfatase activity
MEFVPVPGTQLLFCRWETRVKDYAAYARANKVNDAWTKQEKEGVPIGREPEHPVCAVNWDDANAFCEWLTKKEFADGYLPKGMSYRLPTDEEWSRAVGLANEKGDTPNKRHRRDGSDFPWGTEYPPKKIVGNYPETGIDGHKDGYATTAPVGSFPPNKYGLYDLGGNVWEWCEDLYEPGKTERFGRGGAWSLGARYYLLSAYRFHYPPAPRRPDFGFRCVLGASAR